MTQPVFLADPASAAAAASAGTLVLTGREGHHAADVRRLRRGESVDVVDGEGLRLQCCVCDVSRAQVVLDVVRVQRETAPTPRVTVAQALVKHEAADRALSSMTEVGVDEVLPWSAARSIVTWDDTRVQRALARWQAAVAESAKQSRRAWVPRVPAPVTTADLVERVRAADVALVLDRDAADPLAGVTLDDSSHVLVVVGPEGGLTAQETAVLAGAGARPVHLGPTVLRSATAGAVAAAVLLSRSQRWMTRQPQASAG